MYACCKEHEYEMQIKPGSDSDRHLLFCRAKKRQTSGLPCIMENNVGVLFCKGALEEVGNGLFSVFFQKSGSGAGEVAV